MPRASLVMVVFNQLALTRACLESLRRSTILFDLVVVDNGSVDGTTEFCRDFPYPFQLHYHRNAENLGLIRALNQGWRLTDSEFVCFLHNDTEMKEARWLERLITPLERDTAIGLTGLYGARRVRRDGRYAGRTIVHSLAAGPTIRENEVEVAAVDGVCLVSRRSLIEKLGGFDEGYGFFHGYDRDLSFAVRETGGRLVVVNAPFVHRGGGTRSQMVAVGPLGDDLDQRRRALARFADKWQHRLPYDVRGPVERLRDLFSTRTQGTAAV